MHTNIRTLALVACGLAAATASAGYNEYTSTVKDGIKDVTLTVNETIITDTLSEPSVDTLRFTRSSNFYTVKLRSLNGNDLPGGIVLNGFNLHIQNPNVLGTGPIVLSNDWSSLYVDYNNPDVQNRVVIGSSSAWISGQGAYTPTLHNIGFIPTYTERKVKLGRDNSFSGSVRLLLDGSENDPVGYFSLRDGSALTIDGGTLRAASNASAVRDFFRRADAGAKAPTMTIANTPLTLETSGGLAVRLGLTPSFSSSHTNEVFREEYKTDDWSFESGIGNWKFVQSTLNTSFQTVNGQPYDTRDGNAWTTTNGNKYVMLRLGAQVYRNFDVPTTGKWKVVFERGCRPDSTYSMNMSTTVYVDDEAVCTFPALTKTEEKHPFKEFSTGLIELTKGAHKIAIGIDGSGSLYSSLNFDAIRLQRYDVVVPAHAIAKTGEGMFVLNDVDKRDLSISVKAGTLACENTVLPNAAIAVASGAELNAAGLTAAGAMVDVAAGGRLSFRAKDASDLIANGGFEMPETKDNSFCWTSDCKWTLYPWEGSDRPVIQRNGGKYCPSGNSYPTPYGDQFLLLRIDEAAYQSVSVPADGTYALSFAQSYRKEYQSPGLTVAVDGNAVLTVSGADAQHDFEQTTVNVVLSKGNHEIRFTAQSGNNAGQYSRLSIDNVSLVTADVNPSDLSTATLNLKSGSVVRLDNPEKVAVGVVTVDGVAVRGGAGALRAAGVMVEGAGRIQCGKPLGICIFVR